MTTGYITGLDHVQVAVPANAEAACRTFYVHLLGMTEIEKPPLLARRGGIWVSTGGQQLHCGVESDFRPARKAHPALAVRGIEALAARLEGASHALVWDDANPGVRRFITHDPFGNRLDFVAVD